jgi:hypothetical protein
MEFKSKDHRVFTSSIQEGDCEWVIMVKVHSPRKKWNGDARQNRQPNENRYDYHKDWT